MESPRESCSKRWLSTAFVTKSHDKGVSHIGDRRQRLGDSGEDVGANGRQELVGMLGTRIPPVLLRSPRFPGGLQESTLVLPGGGGRVDAPSVPQQWPAESFLVSAFSQLFST